MRQRIKRAKGAIIASSDFNHVKASREVLAATHEDRMKSISLMTFSTDTTKQMNSLRRHSKSYTKVFGKIVYADEKTILGARMNLYWT